MITTEPSKMNESKEPEKSKESSLPFKPSQTLKGRQSGNGSALIDTQSNGEERKEPIRKLKSRTAAQIEPKPVTWLWKNYIPLGMLCDLVGDPGLGKSTLTIDLASRISRGDTEMPVNGETDLDEPSDVLILNAEDSPEQTLVPRLIAANADLNRIHIIEAAQTEGNGEEPPVLPADLKLIEEMIREKNAKLVIVDPFSAYLSGEYDAHRDQDVRRCLHRLKTLAEETQCTILLVRHLNKKTGENAKYRGGGSIGIIGAARSALMVGENPNDQRSNVFAVVKCNLVAMPPSLTYSMRNTDNGVSAIKWGEETTVAANDLTGCPKGNKSPTEACADAIRDYLADGKMSSKELEEKLTDDGYSRNAIKEGRKKVKVVSVKEGYGKGSCTYLRLPGQDGESSDEVPECPAE